MFQIFNKPTAYKGKFHIPGENFMNESKSYVNLVRIYEM
jgi:hypothetical protein